MSIDTEIFVVAATLASAAVSATYSLVLVLRRAKLEVKLRNRLDSVASKDRRINGIIKDADSSFSADSDSIRRDEVKEFRDVLSHVVPRKDLSSNEIKLLNIILNKSDAQMMRYSQRLAHSVAGRRTALGKVLERIINYYLRLFGLWY